MSVNREFEMTIRRHINNTDSMFLPRRKFHLILTSRDRTTVVIRVQSVEKSIVSGDGSLSFLVVCRESRFMIPICDAQWTEIDIPICACRTVDDERRDKTVGVLKGEMAVVPCTSVGSCSESIREGITGSNGT
jgi:hypothetical protein